MTEQPTLVFRAARALTVPGAARAFRLSVSGAELLPGGGFVLCANHRSGLDAWALTAPLAPRQPRYMAKAELFRPPLRGLLDAAGVFPAARGTCCVSTIRTAIAHARAGRAVIVFPQGSRQPYPPRPGAAYVALAAGVPLVPAAIAGTERLGRPWRVAFGEPIDLAELAALPRCAASQEATVRLWRRIEQLRAELA